MTATILNAAPMTISLGTQDRSIRQLVPEAEALPQHLPKIYIYAEKGPVEPQLVSGGSRALTYGSNSFDIRMPYATHATVLANIINGRGNAAMYQRIKPVDAKTASLRLYLDVLKTTLPEYERQPDGSIRLDAQNQPVPTGVNVAGYKAKWVVAPVSIDPATGVSTFGAGTVVAGDQVDTATSTQSTRYPIGDWDVSSFGNHGNNIGLRLYAPTQKSSDPVDTRLISLQKIYPFRIACVSRTSADSTPTITPTIFNEQSLNVTFKKDVLDRNTDAMLYVGDVFINAYQDLENASLPPRFGPFGRFKLYDDNVELLTEMFYAAEKTYITEFSDFTGEADEAYRFNFVSGVSSFNVPYNSFQIVSGTANSIRLSEAATAYAAGGADGAMNETLFADLVAEAVTEYADPNSPLQDDAKYPESIIYDSGFPIKTKYALVNFMAIRKDTCVVLSTHDVMGPQLSASQESSLAIALRTRLQMFPESEFFGTSTMRGVIMGRSGKLLNNQYRNYLPLTIELASKSAAYMGAGNGRWTSGLNFDLAPNNEVTLFTDVNVTFTPATVRNRDWSNGLNWVESYSRRSLYFPALKTVYDNDTSTLNSYFNMLICVELQKVGLRARRAFSGVSSLTNGQIVDRVNQFVIDNTTGRFDNRVTIVPDAYFTQADIARGYSWTLPIKAYMPNMKTAMTLSIEAYRADDLVTAP